jgi:hypothetical protein
MGILRILTPAGQLSPRFGRAVRHFSCERHRGHSSMHGHPTVLKLASPCRCPYFPFPKETVVSFTSVQ